MSTAAIHGTLLLYTMQKASITQRLMGIMDNITTATMNSTDLMYATNEKRAYYAQIAENDPAYADSTQYEIDSDAVENDYQLQLSQINSWDCQLQQDKNNEETQLKGITTYEESWNTLLKETIKKEFTYGSSGN